MATAASASPAAEATSQLRWMRRAAPLGLLLCEYLTLSLVFDVRPLAERNDWLTALGRLGAVGPLGLAIGTAMLLLRGRELRAALAGAASSVQRGTRDRRWRLLALHGSAFAAFFALTPAIVGAGPSSPPLLLAFAWVASGLAVLGTALHAIVPFSSLVQLLGRGGRALGVGALVGLGAWAAGVWAEQLWKPLADATLVLVAGILRAVGAEVSVDPATATLGVNGFDVLISPDCSGYQGIGLLMVFMGAYLWNFRQELRFPRVLVLVPFAVALVWLANAVRIAALMAVGAWGSSEVALGGFHSKAGWILFCAIALGLVALTRRSPFFHRDVHQERATRATHWNPTASYLMPLLALVAASMTTSLFAAGFNPLHAAGALAGVMALWVYRRDRVRLLPVVGSWSACGLGVATFVLWIALEPDPDPRTLAAFENGLATLPPSAAGLWLFCRFVGSVVVVPVVEELAFRGYLMRRLVSADFTRVPFACFTWPSFFGSSLAFGFLHQSWLAGCLAGVLFALAQYQRGRLSDAIAAHAVANLLIACYVLGWERWSLWM